MLLIINGDNTSSIFPFLVLKNKSVGEWIYKNSWSSVFKYFDILLENKLSCLSYGVYAYGVSK